MGADTHRPERPTPPVLRRRFEGLLGEEDPGRTVTCRWSDRPPRTTSKSTTNLSGEALRGRISGNRSSAELPFELPRCIRTTRSRIWRLGRARLPQHLTCQHVALNMVFSANSRRATEKTGTQGAPPLRPRPTWTAPLKRTGSAGSRRSSERSSSSEQTPCSAVTNSASALVAANPPLLRGRERRGLTGERERA